MNRNNATRYEMLTRTVEFGKKNLDVFPKNSAAGEILKTLESGVGELLKQAKARTSAENAMRTYLNARMSSRNELRGYLTRAGRIARAFHTVEVQLPVNGSDGALIESVRALVEDFGSMSKDFAKHGIPFHDVHAEVETFEKAILDYSTAKAARAAAITASDTAVSAAMATLPLFDTLVESCFKDNSGILASYGIARSIHRLKAHRTKAETPPAPPAPPSPSTPIADATVHAA